MANMEQMQRMMAELSSNPELQRAMANVGFDGNAPWQGPSPDITPQQIREERATRASCIFENYDLLRGILDRHEATVQKRWKKKTKEQKRKVIVSAWKGTEMPKTHRPDIQAFKNRGKVGKLLISALENASSGLSSTKRIWSSLARFCCS